jgi:hypothetical protein
VIVAERLRLRDDTAVSAVACVYRIDAGGMDSDPDLAVTRDGIRCIGQAQLLGAAETR